MVEVSEGHRRYPPPASAHSIGTNSSGSGSGSAKMKLRQTLEPASFAPEKECMGSYDKRKPQRAAASTTLDAPPCSRSSGHSPSARRMKKAASLPLFVDAGDQQLPSLTPPISPLKSSSPTFSPKYGSRVALPAACRPSSAFLSSGRSKQLLADGFYFYSQLEGKHFTAPDMGTYTPLPNFQGTPDASPTLKDYRFRARYRDMVAKKYRDSSSYGSRK